MINSLKTAEDAIIHCENYLIVGDFDLARSSSIPAFQFIADNKFRPSPRVVRFLAVLIGGLSGAMRPEEVCSILSNQ